MVRRRGNLFRVLLQVYHQPIRGSDIYMNVVNQSCLSRKKNEVGINTAINTFFSNNNHSHFVVVDLSKGEKSSTLKLNGIAC
jgi:hypothetical protein